MTDIIPGAEDITLLKENDEESTTSSTSDSKDKIDFKKRENKQKPRLDAKQTKGHKNRQRESDVRKAANKPYSGSQQVRKAEEKQQESLATSMFGAKEERAKKLMGMAQCLQTFGEKEKERARSKAKLPINNGAGNIEEDEV